MGQELQRLLLDVCGDAGVFVRSGIVRLLGGNGNAAILLSQYLYWQSRKGLNEWFFNTANDVETQTGLSVGAQATARRAMLKLGVIEQQLKKAPSGAPTTHIRVNMARLVELMRAALDFPEPLKSISRNPENGFSVTPEILIKRTKITTEITTDIKEGGEAKKPDQKPEQVQGPTAPQRQLEDTTTTRLPSTGDQWRELRALADKVHSELGPDTTVRLLELKGFDKRADRQYWAWLREHVMPQMERLGVQQFREAAAAGVKRAVVSTPGFCLRDFLAVVEAWTPNASTQPPPPAEDEWALFEWEKSTRV